MLLPCFPSTEQELNECFLTVPLPLKVNPISTFSLFHLKSFAPPGNVAEIEFFFNFYFEKALSGKE